MKNVLILLLWLVPYLGITQYVVETIPFESIQPISNGHNLEYSNGNVYSEVISLPFNFQFYGATQTKLKIGPNGGLTFNAVSNGGWEDYLPQTFPNTSRRAMKNAILVHHDLNPTKGGTISYGVDGQSPYRIFKVNYINIPHQNCNNLTSTFQIALHETTNRIEIRIADKPVCTAWNNGYAAIAIHNYSGTKSAVAPGRNSGVWTATNEAWRFVPEPKEIAVGFCWKNGDPMPIYNLKEIVSESNEFKILNSYTLHDHPDPVTSSDTINNSGFYTLPAVPHSIYVAINGSEGPIVLGEVKFDGSCRDETNVEQTYCHTQGAPLPTIDIDAAFADNYPGDLNKITSPIRFYPDFLAAYYSQNEITNTSNYSLTSMNERLIVTFLESNGWWNSPKTYKLTFRPVSCDISLKNDRMSELNIDKRTLSIREINVFPNPAENFIQISGQPLLKVRKLRVYNSQGQQMMVHNVQQQSAKIDIHNLPTGLYAITGEVDGIPFSKKFLKR